eukprot:2204283-Rhodomonas_salina.1
MQTKIIFVLLILKCCKAFLLPGSTARGWLSVHPRTGLSSSPSLPLSSAPQRVSPPLNLFASSTTSHQSHSLPIQLVRPGNEFLAAVDPFWSWNKRNTGVEEKWKAHLGTWTHFNSTGLAMHPPQPWTSGRVRKGLRRSDPEDSQFELWSCFESNARGSFASHTPREVDPHWDLRYNFVKNPWRISRCRLLITLRWVSCSISGTDRALRASRLKSIAPEKWHGPWPEESDVLRVTVVKPDACTVSFVPYLPPLESVQNAIRSGIACAHTFSCELWLAEEVNGVKEAIKSGIFMSYDVVSGELKQLIQLRELSLSEPGNPPPLATALLCMRCTALPLVTMRGTDRSHAVLAICTVLLIRSTVVRGSDEAYAGTEDLVGARMCMPRFAASQVSSYARATQCPVPA